MKIFKNIWSRYIKFLDGSKKRSVVHIAKNKKYKIIKLLKKRLNYDINIENIMIKER